MYEQDLIELVKSLKSEDSIWEILKDSNYNYMLCLECIDYVKTDEKILTILKHKSYNYNLCKRAIKNLKSEKKIMLVLEKTNYENSIYREVLKHCTLSDKSLLFLIEKTKGTFELNKKHYWNLINFSKKIDSDLMSIIRSSKFNPYILKLCLPKIKSDTNIWIIIEESEFDFEVCKSGLQGIKSIERAKIIIEYFNYDINLLQGGVSKLTPDDLILKCIEKTKLNLVEYLKQERNIIKSLKILNYNREAIQNAKLAINN